MGEPDDFINVTTHPPVLTDVKAGESGSYYRIQLLTFHRLDKRQVPTLDPRCRLERNDDVWTNHSSVHSTQGVNQILCQLTRNRRRVQVVTTCGSVVNFFKFSFLRIQGLTSTH